MSPPRPLRILEISAGVGVNGAVMHCRLVARELARRGHRVTLLCPPGSWIAAQLADEEVEILSTDLRIWPGRELRRLTALCRERGIEVIHTHMTRAHNLGLLLGWRCGAPCVAAAQNRSFQLHWRWNDRVIACCEATRRYHRRVHLLPGKRISTVPNFVDPSRFGPGDATVRAEVRQRWSLPDSTPLLIVVGDVIARKGVIHLIRALPTILKRVPEVRVLLVGSTYGRYPSRVQAEAENLGVSSRVLWAGGRGDVPLLLAAGDLFVLPTLDDDLPLAILEAMASALPVVSTQVGGVPECVVPGVTGELVPPHDPSALAAAVVTLLLDPERRRRFGAAGREAVRERFSAAVRVPEIEALLTATARPAC